MNKPEEKIEISYNVPLSSRPTLGDIQRAQQEIYQHHPSAQPYEINLETDHAFEYDDYCDVHLSLRFSRIIDNPHYNEQMAQYHVEQAKTFQALASYRAEMKRDRDLHQVASNARREYKNARRAERVAAKGTDV